MAGQLAFGLCSDPEADPRTRCPARRPGRLDRRARGRVDAKGKLAEYERKRDFSTTREPSGKAKRKGKAKRSHPRVQKHSATSATTCALEVDGVLASWAVPKRVVDPRDKRLAM